MPLLDLIDRLIREHGSASILKEHLALVREQVQILEKQKADAETEAARLKRELADCQRELAAKASSEEFVEHRGALFKRKAGGGYHEVVYCPDCHRSTSAGLPGEGFPFSCKCGWNASFTDRELPEIMKELP